MYNGAIKRPLRPGYKRNFGVRYADLRGLPSGILFGSV